MKIKTAAAVALIGALATMVVIQKNSLDRLRGDLALLKTRSRELEALRTENERLKSREVGPAELERLRKTELDLMRLRNEKGGAHPPTQMIKPIKITNVPDSIATNENPYFQTFRATNQARVNEGDTIVAGGWLAANGHRNLIFVTTETLKDYPDQFDIHVRCVATSDSAVATVGLNSIKTDGAESSSQKILTAQEFESVFNNLARDTNTSVFANHRVLTRQDAEISMSDPKMFPGFAEPVSIGPTIRISPKRAEDGSGFDIGLRMEVNMVRPGVTGQAPQTPSGQ